MTNKSSKAIIKTLMFSGMLVCHVSAHSHEAVALPQEKWSFNGLFGTFDRAQLQRGYQVYKEVCAACHGVKRIAYRNLGALGFSANEIKALAAASEIEDGFDDEGKPFHRPGLPKDHLADPFPNEKAARAANNGSLPPDLSLIVKARVGGANYVHALLTGYVTPPAGVHVDEGRHYNAYFPGHQIAMPAPLHVHGITYADGTEATVERMARDVVTFLAWTSEPEMEERKQTGVKVFLYLLFMTVIFYATMRRIWKPIKH